MNFAFGTSWSTGRRKKLDRRPVGPYEVYQTELPPAWCSDQKIGLPLLATLGRSKDEFYALLLESIARGYIADNTDRPALALLASERQIPMFPNEKIEQFRTRIANAWDFHTHGGTDKGIITTLAQYGYNATIVLVRNSEPAKWAEFDINLRPGSRGWDNTQAELARIVALINATKSAHTKLNVIRYTTTTKVWNDLGKWVTPNADKWGNATLQIYP